MTKKLPTTMKKKSVKFEKIGNLDEFHLRQKFQRKKGLPKITKSFKNFKEQLSK